MTEQILEITDTIIGFKCIAYDLRKNAFISPSIYSVWYKDRAPKAECKYHPHHDAPDINCFCGFHVTYNPEIALEYLNEFNGKGILGLFCGRGKIQLHENGFRAKQILLQACVTIDQYQSGTFYYKTINEYASAANEKMGVPIMPIDVALEAISMWNPIAIQYIEQEMERKKEL